MKTVLQNITLIDGTGASPAENAIVAIHDGRIQYAGSATGWTISGEDWLKLDLHGGYVLPGLIELTSISPAQAKWTASSAFSFQHSRWAGTSSWQRIQKFLIGSWRRTRLY